MGMFLILFCIACAPVSLYLFFTDIESIAVKHERKSGVEVFLMLYVLVLTITAFFFHL